MKVLVAIPCMDMMHTQFVASLIQMKKDSDTQITFARSSLIYDARNTLADIAIRNNFDRVLWLDSDMIFEPDLMERLSARLDEGYDMVSALYVTRKEPIRPCAYSHVQPSEKTISISDYDGKGLVRIYGCGFGAVMMNTSLIKEVKDKFDYVFSPLLGLGEDLSFCYRVTALGKPMYCDTDIRIGHCGTKVYTCG